MDRHQLFKAKSQVPSRAAPREICGGHVALEQRFIRVLRLSLSISLHECSVLIFTHVLLLPEEQKWNNQVLFQGNSLSENGEPTVQKYFHLFFSPRKDVSILLFVCCLFSWRYNPLWFYFHSPVAGFSLLVFEVS
jgi:hypothetical protein